MTPTREEVIRVAREAGAFLELSTTPEKDMAFLLRFAQHFYEAGAAAARKPLTEHEIGNLVIEHLGPACLAKDRMSILDGFVAGVRAAQKAHGIAKATGEKT